MKFGSHNFHVVDGIGDLIIHFWRSRQAFTMQDLVRRFLKCAALFLVAYAMMYVLYPTQYRGWLLWLGPNEAPLAKATAVVLVCFNAMILTLVREAWTHRHRILASASGVFMAVLMLVVLGGTWNYYAATSFNAVATSTAATEGAGNRVGEAQTALADLEKSHALSAAGINAAIANAPANRLNGRAALLRQKASDDAAYRTDHMRLETELRDARAAHVTTITSKPDPRPIDATMAKWFSIDRTFMGSINDLIRSMNFEFIAVLGVALGTAVALSRAGAPKEETHSTGLAIEDMRADARHDEAPQPGERVVDKREVVYGEDGEPLVFRKATYARKPKTARSARRGDETEYEAPARTSESDPRVHGDIDKPWTIPTNMGAKKEEAQDESHDENVPAISDTIHLGDRVSAASEAAEHGADDEPDPDISSVERVEGDQSVDGAGQDGPEPPPLTEDQIARLVENEDPRIRVDSDTGDVYLNDLEGEEQIRLDDDAPRYPQITHQLEAAK